MSTKYEHGDIVPTEVLASRLNELADSVTKGPDAVSREFTMRIPAELDRDADLVLSQAAMRLRELEAAYARYAGGVSKAQISEAIFGYGLRNDDGNNLSMDDTDEIAEYILRQSGHPVGYAGGGAVKKDYIRRLIAGVRRSIDQDHETIAARRELGEEVTIGRWVDASILCDVVEQDVLSATPAQPKVPDTAVDLLKAAQGAIRLEQPDTAHGYISAVIDVLAAKDQTK